MSDDIDLLNDSRLTGTTPLQAALEAGITVESAPAGGDFQISRVPAQAADASDVTGIVVTADTAGGQQWGCAQALMEQHAGLPVTIGTFTAPLHQRMLHVDAGRHYFSFDHLAALIRLMAWCRLNVMNLHISENLGYRLESRLHPEITSEEHLSFEELDRLQALAAECGVTIIPSFDMPGHLEQVLQHYPWAQLRDNGQPVYSALDILNPDAVALVWDILDEVIDAFNAHWVTIGGDEFLEAGTQIASLRQAATAFGPGAREHDVWIDFVNQTIRRLTQRGIRVGVFNDGVHANRVVQLDPHADVHYWTRWGAHMAPPAQLSSHPIFNWNGNACYFVLRRDQLDQLPTFDSVWSTFDPHLFPDRVGSTYLEDVEGACFSIWCDQPDALTSTSVVRMVKAPLMAFSHRCWQLGCLRDKEVVRTCLSL